MTTPSDVRPARPRPRMRPVSVTRVEPLTRRMVRLTVSGPELSGFERTGAAGHVRIWIPNADGDLVYPGSVPEGVEVPVERRSPTRVYTPRRFDPERLELDLDIVLHGVGPCSTWAEQARVGDRLVIAGPGGIYVPSATDWYLLAGDETAVPAIATLLEALAPTTRVQVVLEVQDESDEQPLPPHQLADVQWFYRGAATPGERLIDALSQVALPHVREARAFVACEASAVRTIRRDLLARGVESATLHTRGYWKLNAPNHPDHDMGTD